MSKETITPKTVGELNGETVVTSLQNENQELVVVRDMLDKVDSVLDNKGNLVRISSFNGPKREFLKKRYFDLIYQTGLKKEPKEPTEELVE